jgi:hypothetical protein
MVSQQGKILNYAKMRFEIQLLSGMNIISEQFISDKILATENQLHNA